MHGGLEGDPLADHLRHALPGIAERGQLPRQRLSQGYGSAQHRPLGRAALFTSIYQLLPIYPCFDPGDGTLKRTTETTIPHVDRAKAEAALAFHHEIRDAATRNGENAEYQDARYGIHAVVGNVQPTYQSARADGGKVAMLRSYDGKDDKGDGTVPRVSSTPLEVKDEAGAMYSNERHGSLQNADPVLNQLAGVATAEALRTDRFKAVAGTALALELEEAYLDTEPVWVG